MYKLKNYSELPSIQGIYFITNIVNQKYYLGRAVNIKERYTWGNLEYSHHNEHLRNSIKKHSRENFIIRVEEYPNISLEELINIEQELLDKHCGNGLCYNKSKSASGGKVCEINPGYGKKWYNDGIENKRFNPDGEIPEGFILGMSDNAGEKNPMFGCTSEKNHNYGKKWYNDGIENKLFNPDGEIPGGFILGMLDNAGEKNHNYGKKWYNNRIENRLFSPDREIPEGYVIGRKPISEETRKKRTEAKKSINSKKKIRVITSLCCYFSMIDARKELGISNTKFYKLFEKDPTGGYFVEK
jgi:group I intron endonuclease